jgi:cytochrome c
MDSIEISKFVGAVLLAALTIILPKTLLEMSAQNNSHGEGHAQVGYPLPGAEPAVAATAGTKVAAAAPAGVKTATDVKPTADVKPAGESKPTAVAAAPAAGAPPAAAAPAAAPTSAPAGAIFASIKPLLAAAKPENGAATFKACAACHSPDKGGANKVGPALWGVVGRGAGSVDGFGYSAGLKALGGEWSYERLAGFLNNPKGYVAGTKMAYAGIADPEKLADVLAYLGTLSDAPVPMPK